MARHGSDEFAVSRASATAVRLWRQVAERILDHLAEPLDMAGATISIEATVGMARGPRPTRTAPS